MTENTALVEDEKTDEIESSIEDELLVEEVSIDGLCGVY